MKTLNWIIISILSFGLTIFVACAKPTTSSPAGSSSGKIPKQFGTSDGGGGNTCNGRPIESYALDLKSTPAFKKYIQPIYAELATQQNDHFRLFSFVIENKKWYVIPCELEKLPDSKIGSAVKTEQAAIQTFTEVWNYQPLVDKMSEADQAKLFLHEIFMGIKLLKLESAYNQCKSFAPDISYCANNNQERNNKPSDLTTDDYADVRSAAADILQLQQPIPQATFEDFLARRNFSFGTKRFRRLDDIQKISTDELIQDLQKSKITGDFPTIGHFLENGTVTYEGCTIEIPPDGPTQSGIKLLRSNGEQITSVGLPGVTEVELLKVQRFGRSLKSLPLGLPTLLREGERYFDATLYFDVGSGASLFAVLFTEMVCYSEKQDRSGFRCVATARPANGKIYLCAKTQIAEKDL